MVKKNSFILNRIGVRYLINSSFSLIFSVSLKQQCKKSSSALESLKGLHGARRPESCATDDLILVWVPPKIGTKGEGTCTELAFTLQRACTPLRRLRQEDCNFEVSLDHISETVSKEKTSPNY